jgi:transposase-like protein
MTRRSRHYPRELRDRAVTEVGPDYESQWATLGTVARKLGLDRGDGAQWGRQAEVDGRPAAGDQYRGVR